MLKNSLIIMPFHLPWDHPADYQRQTCLVLHKNNLIICYMHLSASFFLKKKPQKIYPKIKNIIFYSPRYFLPFRRFNKIEKLNQLLNLLFLSMRYGVRKRVILWIFDPMFYFYPKIKLILFWVKSIYDCVDYHWSRNPDETKLLRIQEKLLIKNVDLFFVNSHTLADIHRSVRHPDKIVPLGFALDIFKKYGNDKLIKNIQLPRNKLIIGYIGSLNWRLDYKLLHNLINKNSQWLFAFFGPRHNDSYNSRIRQLLSHKNVIYGNVINRENIPSIIDQFDVCMIPYNTSYEFNCYCFPMKIFEYFYMGKPVISTPIKELKQFSQFISIYNNLKDWQNSIEKLITQPWLKSSRFSQRKIAILNSWKNKISVITEFLI